MKYMLLIYVDPECRGATPDGATEHVDEDYGRSPRASSTAGSSSPAIRCTVAETATTVRVRNGRPLTSDGPVRRDQGAARRLLRRRRRRPRPRARAGRRDPRRQGRQHRGPPDHGDVGRRERVRIPTQNEPNLFRRESGEVLGTLCGASATSTSPRRRSRRRSSTHSCAGPAKASRQRRRVADECRPVEGDRPTAPPAATPRQGVRGRPPRHFASR